MWVHQIKARGLRKGCRALERNLSPWDKVAVAFHRVLVWGVLSANLRRAWGLQCYLGVPSHSLATQAKEETKYKNQHSREKLCQISSQHQKVVTKSRRRGFLSPPLSPRRAILGWDSVYFSIRSRILIVRDTDFWHEDDYDYSGFWLFKSYLACTNRH